MRPPTYFDNLQALYQYFPVQGGRRTLHCGCDLEEALLGLWIYKMFPSVTSRSDPGERPEAVGKPIDPRTLHLIHSIFTQFFGISVFKLYLINDEGKPQGPEDIRNVVLDAVEFAFDSRLSPRTPTPSRAPNPPAKQAPEWVEVDENRVANPEEDEEIFGANSD
jgi:hypothetical protein